MAQDRGNSYDHTVGVPPDDDDDTDDTATDFNNIAMLVHRQSMQQGSAQCIPISWKLDLFRSVERWSASQQHLPVCKLQQRHQPLGRR